MCSNTSTVLQRQGMGSVVGRTTFGNQRAVSDVLTIRKPPFAADRGSLQVLDTQNGMPFLRRIDHGGR